MDMSRRRLFAGMTSSAFTLGLRSALTGLPVSFLLRGEARASESQIRTAILCGSHQGEGLNGMGPRTYDSQQGTVFGHVRARDVDAGEVGSVTVNGVTLTAEDLERSTELQFGGQTERVASAFRVLSPEFRERITWCFYRTNSGIHPQYGEVIRANGDLKTSTGRGEEELPAMIAQEAPTGRFVTQDPMVISRSGYSSNGKSLPRYSPTSVKTLSGSAGGMPGGAANFGVLYERFIDRTWRHVKQNGSATQRRFLDNHASTRRQAKIFGEGLTALLEEIVDDSIASQLKTAIAIASLDIAPVVVCDYSYTGDNHGDNNLTAEATKSIRMIADLETMWQSAKSLNAQDKFVYGTMTVFGRTCQVQNGGRGHDSGICVGMLMGTHLAGGTIGDIDTSSGRAKCSGINTQDRTGENPDVAADNTMPTYYRAVASAAGVSPDRLDVRLPTGKDIQSL